MTPDTLALARAIGTLPGAPTWKYDSVNVVIDYDRADGSTGRRSANGLGWVRDPDDGRYVLDLEDAGTGGVLLARAAGLVGTVEITSDTYYLRRDTNAPVIGDGPTLGIAVARLIIARGGF